MAKPELTDDEAREIARRLIAEAQRRPNGDLAAEDNATELDAQSSGSQSAADANEDRIERALVELGFVSPDAIAAADPDGGSPG